jgi:uncharacterized protein YodC (DUF2158 family)
LTASGSAALPAGSGERRQRTTNLVSAFGRAALSEMHMSETSLKPGDVVQLRSGGPAMTLVSTDASIGVCLWFDAQERRDSQPFPMHVLRPFRPQNDGSWTLSSIERRAADKV